MKQIVEFPLESGESILVEVDKPASDFERVALGDDVVQLAQRTFESALEQLKPVATIIMTKILNLNESADEVEVKFGIKMSAEFGAVIASGSAEVNYEVTLKWQQKSKNDHTS